MASKKKFFSKKLSIEIVAVILALVLIAAVAIGALYFFAPDTFDKIFGGGDEPSNNLVGNVVEVNFFNIGQGDCIIIRFPDGKNMIIDAGGPSSTESTFNASLKPFIDSLGIKRFDYLMATHTDKDHVGYLDEVLDNYEVVNIYRPAFRAKSEVENKYGLVSTNVYNEFIQAANSEPGAVIHDNVGKARIQGDGYYLDIYSPKEDAYLIAKPDAFDLNYVSPFVLLGFGDRSVMFTGDAEGKGGNNAEQRIIDSNAKIDCDVLKVGHHGSASSASNEFLDKIDPEYAVISVGADNSHGHPRNECLERLNSYRDRIPDDDHYGIAKTYRTDLDGTIKLRIADNGALEFVTEIAA